MIREIPAQRIRVCDVCGNQSGHKLSGTINFVRNGLDYLGSPVGPCGSKLDLCDRCTMSFESRLDSWFKEWKRKDGDA